MKGLIKCWINNPMFWAFITGLNVDAIFYSIRDSRPWWWLLMGIVAIYWSADQAIKTRRKEVRP